MNSPGNKPAGSDPAGKPPKSDFLPLHPPEATPPGRSGPTTPPAHGSRDLPHSSPQTPLPPAPPPGVPGRPQGMGHGRPPMVTPPAGLPVRPATRPNAPPPNFPPGAIPATTTPPGGVKTGRVSGSVQVPGRTSGSVNITATPAGGTTPAPGASVAGTMEAIQLLMAVRGAASKVKQTMVVDQISHGLQSLGIKMADSKGQLPAMKTPTAAVPASAFIDLLLRIFAEAKKAKQFSLAERIRSGLEGMGHAIHEGPDHSNVSKRVKP